MATGFCCPNSPLHLITKSRCIYKYKRIWRIKARVSIANIFSLEWNHHYNLKFSITNKLQAFSLYLWIIIIRVCLLKSQTCVEKSWSNKTLHHTNGIFILRTIRYNSLRKNCTRLSCVKEKNCRSLLRLIIESVTK